QAPALALAPQPQLQGGGEVVEAVALEQHLVELGKKLLGPVDLAGEATHRVAQGDRAADGDAALAGDVADHDPATVLGRQDVVEIAADLHPFAEGVEDDRDVYTLDER